MGGIGDAADGSVRRTGAGDVYVTDREERHGPFRLAFGDLELAEGVTVRLAVVGEASMLDPLAGDDMRRPPPEERSSAQKTVPVHVSEESHRRMQQAREVAERYRKAFEESARKRRERKRDRGG